MRLEWCYKRIYALRPRFGHLTFGSFASKQFILLTRFRRCFNLLAHILHVLQIALCERGVPWQKTCASKKVRVDIEVSLSVIALKSETLFLKSRLERAIKKIFKTCCNAFLWERARKKEGQKEQIAAKVCKERFFWNNYARRSLHLVIQLITKSVHNAFSSSISNGRSSTLGTVYSVF